MKNLTVSVVGASGYVGGELLRLLFNHPLVQIGQITSERYQGKFVHRIHPHLRGVSNLKFCTLNDLQPCDVLFLCLPHGTAQQQIDFFQSLAPRIIDLSADFRLNRPEMYCKWYGIEHSRPELLTAFVYGIPELHRQAMRQAHYISSAGCNATAVILGLFPLFSERLVDAQPIVCEVKVGSSEGGNKVTPASHHPIRSGCVRSFKPTGHRHSAEIEQELGQHVHLSVTSVEMVRGVLATTHIFLRQPLSEKEIWKLYRQYYASEPFIRIVKERDGLYRYPEPKLLSGTNYCDIGFELDSSGSRIVVISAIDNLMKGAAGQAVQAFNLMNNFPEATALEFSGLHPL